MATKQRTIDYILEQISGAGEVLAKKMFGEYGLYYNGKVVAFVCDDQLYLKPTEAGKAFIGDYTEGRFYPNSKLYLLIPPDRWEEREWLTELVRITAAELPTPQPKKPRHRRKS